MSAQPSWDLFLQRHWCLNLLSEKLYIALLVLWRRTVVNGLLRMESAKQDLVLRLASKQMTVNVHLRSLLSCEALINDLRVLVDT